MALSIGELVGYVQLDTSPAEGAVDKMGGIFDSAGSGWTKLLGGFGLAGGAALATSLIGAMNLEPGRDKLAASLGLTETQAAQAGKVAGDLYSAGWGETADDVNLALESVMSSIKGMRGASEGELAAATEAALAFSTVMGVDVGKAAQVAGQMVKNGLATNAVEAFDLLTAASSKVPASVREDVLDAADEYGQFFAAVGMDGPAAMGLLAKGAEQGMYGIDKAGDAIKEFTIRSTDMSESSKAAYEAIGLDADDMATKMLAGGDTAGAAMDKIVDGLLSIKDPTDQGVAAIGLFGTPLEDLGTKNIPTFLKSLQDGGKGLGDFAGATEKAGDTLSDNAAGNLTVFSRKLKGTFIDLLGGQVLPKVTELTGYLANGLGPAFDTVGDAVGSASDFLSKHKEVLGIVAGIILAVFIPHLIALGIQSGVTAGFAVTSWLLIQGAAIKAALVHSLSIMGMVAGWVLMGAQSLIQAGRMAAAWVIAMGPIGWVIAAVVGLVALIVANWDTVRAWTTKAWSAVSDAVAAAWKWISEKVAAGTTSVVDFVKGIPGKFTGALSNLGSALSGAFGSAMNAGRDRVTNIGQATAEWLVELPGKFSNKLSGLLSTVRGLFGDAMESGKEKVTGIGATIVGWIAGVPGKMLDKLGAFKDAGRDLLQGFVDGMKNAAGVIEGIASSVWSMVKGLLNGAINKINNALEFKISLGPAGDFPINPPDIPQLATGGRATGATLAVIGEGREAESVLPDSVLRGLMERAHNAGRDSATGGGSEGRNGPLIGTVVQQVGESADVLAERLWFKTRTRG